MKRFVLPTLVILAFFAGMAITQEWPAPGSLDKDTSATSQSQAFSSQWKARTYMSPALTPEDPIMIVAIRKATAGPFTQVQRDGVVAALEALAAVDVARVCMDGVAPTAADATFGGVQQEIRALVIGRFVTQSPPAE